MAVIFGLSGARVEAQPKSDELAAATVTNVAQLCRLASRLEQANYSVRLEGGVRWVSQGQDQLMIQDETGVAAVKLGLSSVTPLQPGQKIRLEGMCLAGQGEIASRALVDNDGLHYSAEMSGTVFLSQGLHPIRVEWFNGTGDFDLETAVSGPEMPRQPIPNGNLFRAETISTAGTNRLVQGLDYYCYEGQWACLPDFARLPVINRGTVANFDLGVMPRMEGVGLVYKGYFAAPEPGLYTFWAKSDDGSRLFIGDSPLRVSVLGTATLPAARRILPGQGSLDENDNQWCQLEGIVTFISELSGPLYLEVNSSMGPARLNIADRRADAWQPLLHRRIKASGIFKAAWPVNGQTGYSLLAPNLKNITVLEPAGDGVDDSVIPGRSKVNSAGGLPLLTRASQVTQLNRLEAQRGYPVKIKGVITAWVDDGFTIEDSSGPMYFASSVWKYFVFWQGQKTVDLPRVGDYWEIEGTTTNNFAPSIRISRAVCLGMGMLPEPLRPTWDKLINGSLNSFYIEVQGIVTAATTNSLVLLTRGGEVSAQIADMNPTTLKSLEDALIRVRGVNVPELDTSQQLLPARVRLFNASLNIDEPAPADPFATPLKHAADLLLFDPRADALQRVRVAGQLQYARYGEYFLMDGTRGLRFRSKAPVQLQAGDMIEVVGFLALNGSSPTLQEAVVRRTGHRRLPEARRLSEANLLSGKLDAALVGVLARLVGISADQSGQVLELQAGNRGFVARLPNEAGLLPGFLPGSILDLTGVYAGQGGGLARGRDFDSFELLLNSAADVRLVARPSWWTRQHRIAVLGSMGFGILAALVWIRLLRREVEMRSRRLAAEIKLREKTEHQRTLEAERSRIAQDLHDEIGATLTQIRFLSAVRSGDSSLPEPTRAQLRQVSEKSRQTVASLDEIVWAVNPANDSLRSLAAYLRPVAEEFFRITEISCRFDIDKSLPAVVLTSEVRHNLYLSVLEAMNNGAKHSQATEIWLRIHWREQTLHLEVEDNGVGFMAPESLAGNGLANMQRRLAKIGGCFQYDSRPGFGTICRMSLPLPDPKL